MFFMEFGVIGRYSVVVFCLSSGYVSKTPAGNSLNDRRSFLKANILSIPEKLGCGEDIVNYLDLVNRPGGRDSVNIVPEVSARCRLGFGVVVPSQRFKVNGILI